MILPLTGETQNRETHNVSITVKADGKEVTMLPGGLISLSIGLELNRIPWARLVFADGAVEKQEFAKSNLALFSPGKTVEILLGYNQQEETVFKGIIIRHAVKVQQARYFRLEIECRDAAVKTTVARKSRYFYNLSDKDLVQNILNDYPDVKIGTLESPGYTHNELVQYNVTDWDFMLLRADANGLCLNLLDGDLHMKKPAVKPTPDLQVQFGVGSTGIPILEFESELDARDHYPEVKGSTWDYTRQEVMEESAGAAGGPAAGLLSQAAGALTGGGGAQRDFPDVLYKDNPVQLYHGGDMDTQELSAWAAAKQQRGTLSHVKGRASVNGVKVQPGDTLEVNGVGDRFNGTHLISAVLHQVVNGQWKTDVQFGWNKNFTAENITPEAADAAGLVGGIRGLHAGIVSKIAGDTRSGDYRVQVRLPYVAQNPNSTSADGIWARLVNIYAGNDRGFIFRPELNDEVIIGFINNDPNDAVVLGAVHSDKNTAPQDIPASDQNPKKGFISKAGMQFLFDDDNKKIILSAGDSNSPKIELDGSGQKISIVLDGSTSIELSAQGIKINGTRIDLN
ncbi:type VI secretion system tip protein VgrG [Chitinophaga sp. 22321]|uniref:Type VI secretion system tip protein VgrG n=1 Tax=Chitinophaga hostae TaxID=2831022 RepID=A0ABS5J601_9BACT|nr:type VI secretion system tip protein VgrG [Chitinophaga hostae]MBS0030002.1 type VI secretion system tip protein VgrG [Chitinophaga hostae]